MQETDRRSRAAAAEGSQLQKDGQGSEHTEGALHYLESLPAQLRELWENPREMIDIPPNAFFRVKDDRKREELIREFEQEMIKIARREIRVPDGASADTEFSEAVFEPFKKEIRGRIELLREYAMERVEERHELRYYDPLTGKLNGKGLEQRFHTELKRLETLEDGKVMVLIEFDIDSFKDVNEMLTHVGADKMIVKLAEVVGSVVGELDSVGRNGGDEFSVILNNVDPDKLASILQRITTAVSKIEYTKSHEDGTVENTGRHMSITGSARVIERGEDVSYEHIKKQADQGAIFQKINKKGSLIEWSPDLKPDLSTYEKRWEWASKLASTKINRDANELYAEWRGHPEGSSDRSITAYQIGLLTGVNPEYDNEKKGETPDTSMADSILEYLTQINIAAIEKRYGPPEDEDER